MSGTVRLPGASGRLEMQAHRFAGFSLPRAPICPRGLSRRCVRVASSNPAGAQLEGTVGLDDLHAELQRAVANEEYAAAAKLRDQIKQIQLQDPITSLQAQLQAAIANERYGDAALLRDQLKELLPPPAEPCPTSSTKVTDGIRVSVESSYVPGQSRPAAGAYLFAYKITILNESHAGTVKLVSRHWIITDAEGKTQEVKGPGVVGEQPELAPGESFSYQSACPLRTPAGSMRGEYEFYSKQNDKWSTSFMVEVGEFGLSIEGPQSL